MPPNTFDYVKKQANVMLDRNCIDTSVNFVNTDSLVGGGRKNQQKACPIITYNPTTPTTGTVLGTVIFVGGKEGDRILLNNEPSPTRLWIENEEYVFDFSHMANSGLLLYDRLTGYVDWIIVPAIELTVLIGVPGQTVTLNKYFANAFAVNR